MARGWGFNTESTNWCHIWVTLFERPAGVIDTILYASKKKFFVAKIILKWFIYYVYVTIEGIHWNVLK